MFVLYLSPRAISRTVVTMSHKIIPSFCSSRNAVLAVMNAIMHVSEWAVMICSNVGKNNMRRAGTIPHVQ